MNHRDRSRLCLLLAVLGVVALFSFQVHADEIGADEVYCFHGTEFTATQKDADGVYICAVPAQSVGVLQLGARTIRSGDVLPGERLSELTFTPCCETATEAEIRYCPIQDGTLCDAEIFRMKIRAAKNTAPVAEDATLETYRNLPNEGRLHAEDPDGDAVQYQLVDAPKLGEVSLEQDGSFVYTPRKNKLGDDSFSFTATDAAGNTSNVAWVRITILKPQQAQTFADAETDTQFLAMWMRENELYSGVRVAERLLFNPGQTVSRGEFLTMAMTLSGIAPDNTVPQSGFVDEQQAPAWMRPYLVGAVRHGIVRGVATAAGLEFRPNEPVTAADAAAILSRCFHLDDVRAVAALTEAPITPAWAAQAVSSLAREGITLPPDLTQPLTRRQVAALLYAVSRLDS